MYVCLLRPCVRILRKISSLDFSDFCHDGRFFSLLNTVVTDPDFSEKKQYLAKNGKTGVKNSLSLPSSSIF